MTVATILKNETANATGNDITLGGRAPRLYQATIKGTGAVSCTVTVQGTNEPPKSATSLWFDINAFSLTGTTNDNQIHESTESWNAVRVVTASMTGTNATVNVTVSY